MKDYGSTPSPGTVRTGDSHRYAITVHFNGRQYTKEGQINFDRPPEAWPGNEHRFAYETEDWCDYECLHYQMQKSMKEALCHVMADLYGRF